MNDLFRPWWVEPEMPPLGPEDEDVARERQRVISGKAQSDILTMTDLSKVQPAFKPKKTKLKLFTVLTLLWLNRSKSLLSVDKTSKLLI